MRESGVEAEDKVDQYSNEEHDGEHGWTCCAGSWGGETGSVPTAAAREGGVGLTESVIVGTAASVSDGIGTPMVGDKGVDHDCHGCRRVGPQGGGCELSACGMWQAGRVRRTNKAKHGSAQSAYLVAKVEQTRGER